MVDVNGVPRVGARRYFYQAGSTTPITTYTTAAYGPTNANPVVSLSDGFFPAVHINPAVNATYKEVLKDSSDVTLWTEDNIATPLNIAADIIASLDQDDISSLLYPQSALEAGASITPTAAQRIHDYGDPRRAPTFYPDVGWVDYGHVPTYINATSFSIPTDLTATYTPYTRVMGVGASTKADLRVVSSAFAASKTTVTITANDTGDTLPTPMLAVWVQRNTSAHSVGNIRFNANLIAGLEIVNAASGSQTAARFCARTLNASGVAESAVCMVAVSPSYTGAYLSGGFSSGARAVIYTPPTMSLEIGTSDVVRITIPNDGTAIGFTSDVAVSVAAATGTLSTSGATQGRISMRANSVEKGYMQASATEVQIGTTAAIDVSFIYNGSRVLTFSGANATGASTPTLGTNKPGSNSSVQEWLTCKNGAGATRYIPMWS